MEAVAAHAHVGQFPWQRELLMQYRCARMEGGVEAGDLRYVGEGGRERAYAGDVVRLVQRREAGQRLQTRDHLVIDDHAASIIATAVHDAVCDCARRCERELVGQQRAQRCERIQERIITGP